MTSTNQIDPAGLSLDELRELRRSCRPRTTSSRTRGASPRPGSTSSTAEMSSRAAHSGEILRDELNSVLSKHLTGGPARPPRPTEDLSDHQLALELEAICAEKGFGRLEDLTTPNSTI